MVPERDVPGGGPAPTRVAQQTIFLSYRRADSQASAGRLADDLRDYFGVHRVYRDLDVNRPAADYVDQIEAALAASCVVIAVIGPRWLESTGSDGTRRLENPDDPVRQELTRALTSDTIILPVLVEGATMPPADALPEPLQPLARRQAHRLQDEHWPYDFTQLLAALAGHGIVPYGDPADADPLHTGPGMAGQVKQALTAARHYERTLKGLRGPTYLAVVGALNRLGYAGVEEDLQASQVSFSVYGLRAKVRVVDAASGCSSVILEFTSVRAELALPALLVGHVFVAAAGAGLLAYQRRFARGFLNNVQLMLEKGVVGEDSALPPGLARWRRKLGRL